MRYVSLAAVVGFVFGAILLCHGVARADEATSAPCNYWVDKNPDAAGVNFITLCQNELQGHANDWRATSDPVEKGRNQLLIGLDYFAIAYYCEYYSVDMHLNVDARCALGSEEPLAVSSINASREAFNNAMSNSNNDPEIVKKANTDLELAGELAKQYNLPFDLKV
ncbi:MAG TPA: hypothetical protein VMS32_10320 [Verrucomicrobiae bacterium]|jgi:hypothetical protein|nr:hypothetical protein [Verrucomicrobiae bacterium]